MIPLNSAVQRWQPTKPDTGPFKSQHGWIRWETEHTIFVLQKDVAPKNGVEKFYFTNRQTNKATYIGGAHLKINSQLITAFCILRTSVPPPLVRLLPVLKHHTKSIIAVGLLGTCGNEFLTGLAKVVLSSVIYYEILVGGKALIKGSAQVLHQHIHGGSWAYKR